MFQLRSVDVYKTRYLKIYIFIISHKLNHDFLSSPSIWLLYFTLYVGLINLRFQLLKFVLVLTDWILIY